MKLSPPTYLFSFETVFVLWLFSYQYKHALTVFEEYDPTLILALILWPWALFLAWKSRLQASASRWPYLMPLFIFAVWLSITGSWSPSHAYMLSKCLSFWVYTVLAFIAAALVIGPSEERSQRLTLSLAFFAMITSIEVIRSFILIGNSANIWGNNYLVSGQTIGTAIVALVPVSLALYQRKGATVASLSLIVLLAYFLYLFFPMGGRGPALACALTVSLYYGWNLLTPKERSIVLKHVAMLGLSTLGIYIMMTILLRPDSYHLMDRLQTLVFTPSSDAPSLERLEYYRSALWTFMDNPITGVGLGGWPVAHGLPDQLWHPHNIFLELLAETGLIGFGLFLGFLWMVLRRWPKELVRREPVVTGFALVLLFSFLNALKSGDLNDNILLFTGLGLMLGASFRRQQPYST